MELVKADSPKPKDFKSFLKDPPFLPALFRRNSTKDAESKDSAELSRLIVEGHDILGQAADLIAQNRWRGDKIVDLDNRWAVLYSTAPVLRKITKGRIHPVQFNNEARTLLADVQAYLSQFPSEPERLQPDEYIQPPRRSNSKSKHDVSRSSSRKHHRNDSLPVIPMTPITEEAPGRVSRSQSVRPSATDRERKTSSRPKEMSRHASDSRALKSTVPETRDKEHSHHRDKPELERSHTERRHESRTRTDGHHSSRDKESSRHSDRHREGHRSRKDIENEHHSSHRRRHESKEPTEHKPKAYDDKPRRGLPPAVLPQLPPASMPPPQAVTYVPYPGMSREEPRKHKSSRSHDHGHREREHSTSSPHRSSSKRHHSSRHASKPRPGEREYGSRFREDLSDYIPR